MGAGGTGTTGPRTQGGLQGLREACTSEQVDGPGRGHGNGGGGDRSLRARGEHGEGGQVAEAQAGSSGQRPGGAWAGPRVPGEALASIPEPTRKGSDGVTRTDRSEARTRGEGTARDHCGRQDQSHGRGGGVQRGVWRQVRPRETGECLSKKRTEPWRSGAVRLTETETSVPLRCGWSQMRGWTGGDRSGGGGAEQGGVGGSSSTCRCTRPLRTSPPPPREGPPQAELLVCVLCALEAAAPTCWWGRVKGMEDRWHWGRGSTGPGGAGLRGVLPGRMGGWAWRR